MSKRALILVVLLALLATAVAIVVALQRVDLRSALTDRLAVATGRSITFEGAVTLRPGLLPGLEVADVAVGPAPGSALRSAQIGRLGLVVELWPLLRGEVEVHRFELADAEAVIEPAAAAGEPDAPPQPRRGERRPLLPQRASVRNLKVEVRRDGEETTTVSIAELTLESENGTQGVEVSATGAVDRIDFDVSGRYDASLPSAGAAKGASLEVEGQIGGAKVSGKGSISAPGGPRAFELRVEASAPSLQVFTQAAGRELPELGPVRASALLKLDADTLAMTDLDLVVGDHQNAWLELTGSAQDVTERRDFSLEADFGLADVRALARLVGNPPDIGRIVGKATVSDVDGTPGIEKFTLQGGRPGVFEIDAKGRFGDIVGVDDLDAHIELTARDLAVLGELWDWDLPPIGAVELSGHVTGRARELASDGFRLRLDRTHFQGTFSGVFPPDQRPRLTAHVEIPVLYLDDVGIEPERESEATQAPKRAAGERLLADTPLDLGWSELADAQLTFHLGEVDGVRGELLDDLRLEASLAKGQLSVRHLAVGFNGGRTTAELQMDSQASPPTFALEGSAKGIDLGRIVEQIDEHTAYSGKLDAKLALKARGASPRAIASGLEGDITLSCGAGTIATEHAGMLTLDLFQSVRRAIGRDRASEVLNCFVADIAFSGGVGTANTLVLDAEDVVIVGEGNVDLRAETLDLRLVPKPRGASPLSTAVTVKIEGPLTHPSVTTAKGTLIASTTQAIFENIGSYSGLRLAREKLGRDPGDPLCARLLASGSSPVAE